MDRRSRETAPGVEVRPSGDGAEPTYVTARPVDGESTAVDVEPPTFVTRLEPADDPGQSSDDPTHVGPVSAPAREIERLAPSPALAAAADDADGPTSVVHKEHLIEAAVRWSAATHAEQPAEPDEGPTSVVGRETPGVRLLPELLPAPLPPLPLSRSSPPTRSPATGEPTAAARAAEARASALAAAVATVKPRPAHAAEKPRGPGAVRPAKVASPARVAPTPAETPAPRPAGAEAKQVAPPPAARPVAVAPAAPARKATAAAPEAKAAPPPRPRTEAQAASLRALSLIPLPHGERAAPAAPPPPTAPVEEKVAPPTPAPVENAAPPAAPVDGPRGARVAPVEETAVPLAPAAPVERAVPPPPERKATAPAAPLEAARGEPVAPVDEKGASLSVPVEDEDAVPLASAGQAGDLLDDEMFSSPPTDSRRRLVLVACGGVAIGVIATLATIALRDRLGSRPSAAVEAGAAEVRTSGGEVGSSAPRPRPSASLPAATRPVLEAAGKSREPVPLAASQPASRPSTRAARPSAIQPAEVPRAHRLTRTPKAKVHRAPPVRVRRVVRPAKRETTDPPLSRTINPFEE